MRRRLFLMCMLLSVLFVIGCDETNSTQTAALQQNQQANVTETERDIVDTKLTKVKLQTSMGDIVIELNDEAAPVTVKNFLDYVQAGHYDGTIFHRVISGFMIQGGGFTADMQQKPTNAPIVNEASNGLKNDRGTIAMARTNVPNSATCQFFINHRNNDPLNYNRSSNPGYAVFGKVIEGMDVVDAIAAVRTTTKAGMQDVPVDTVTIISAKVIEE